MCWYTIGSNAGKQPLFSHLFNTIPIGRSRRGVLLPLIDSNEIICIEETAVTVRSYRRRTTVPSRIFKFLNIQPGDALRWVALKDGTVFITKVTAIDPIHEPEGDDTDDG